MATATLSISRRRRVELLATAEPDALISLADSLIAVLGSPTVDGPPETGVVMLQVREPVCLDRFHLGEVVVSRSRVAWCGANGWGMRLGTDRAAALAAALCDAAAQFDREAATRIDELCARTESESRRQEDAEWLELLGTRVTFEELD